MRTLLTASALLVALTGCTGAVERPGGEADPDPTAYVAPSGPQLAAPAGDVEDNPTVRVLIDNIDHTPAGATIRIVARSFSVDPVARALVAADRRGVHVQVVADGDVSRDYQAMGGLVTYLGTDRRADSFVHLTRGSARGGPTEQHQKSWSFSRTGQSRHVVMVGSMNLSYRSTEEQYTDMWSFVDRRDVWRAFSDVFADQVRDRPLADPAVEVDLGADRAWFFPGDDQESDPVRGVLDTLPDAGTRIRVVMYAWLEERGLALAGRLVEKVRRGAQVEVVAGPSLGARVRAVLDAGGIPVRDAVFGDGTDVHMKLLLAEYDDPSRSDTGADQRRRLVLTGSDNFTTRSLERDEALVAVQADRREYRAYQRFVDDIVDRVERERR